MTLNESIFHSRRLNDLEMADWPATDRNLTGVAKEFARLSLQQVEQIIRVLVRYREWRTGAFLRICAASAVHKGIVPFETLSGLYACTETFNHEKGIFVPVGPQLCECCQRDLGAVR